MAKRQDGRGQLREKPVQIKVTVEEHRALETVRIARGLAGKSLVLREMSLADAVQEAERLRREFQPKGRRTR